MRSLSPTKAISHALGTVWTFRPVAMRIALAWLPVLLVCAIAEIYVGPPDPMAEELNAASFVHIAAFVVSLIATSSMSVSWHRFVLLDEIGSGLRIDGNVMRYAGYTVLFLLGMFTLLLIVVSMMLSAPAAASFGLPAVVLLGGIVTRLSVKLPAVALGKRDFTFRDAWAASAGNFWQCLGVFLLNAAAIFAGFLVLVVIGTGIEQVNPTLAEFAVATGSIALQLFFTFFNASVLTSLYGFFVERRDF